MDNPLLIIENLSIIADETHQSIVSDIDFKVGAKSITALVGGSGSGKTSTGLSILRLLPAGLSITNGKVIFENENLLNASEEKMRQIRGKLIGMIFQEPLVAFNPVFTIGAQIQEVLAVHTSLNKNEQQKKVFELLDVVEIQDPKRISQQYPHQLSGGLRQRAMIAQAIAASPKLVIADEPTSNLDVTLQAKIMELFRTLKDSLGISFVLITHDLGVVSHLADHVAVIHQGRIVEQGRVEHVMKNPQHAFTAQLIETFKI